MSEMTVDDFRRWAELGYKTVAAAEDSGLVRKAEKALPETKDRDLALLGIIMGQRIEQLEEALSYAAHHTWSSSVRERAEEALGWDQWPDWPNEEVEK